MAEVLERAAQALESIAREVRAFSAGRAKDWSGEGSEGRSGEREDHRLATPVQREIAHRVKRFWAGVRMSPVLNVGGESVNLSTAQGRWELVVLAILSGARIRDEVIAETFRTLRRRGLLRLEVLLRPEARQEVHNVFQRHYRALGDRRAKAEALVENARYLVERWNGDLSNLYLAARERGSGLVPELRKLAQIDRMALWICRSLKVRGIWPEVSNEECRYVDRSVRLPLERLPVGYGDENGEERARRALALVDALFEGDILPLHLQGESLCAQDDVVTCLGECPVAPWCRFPKEGGGGRSRRLTPPDSSAII